MFKIGSSDPKQKPKVFSPDRRNEALETDRNQPKMTRKFSLKDFLRSKDSSGGTVQTQKAT